MSIAPSDIDLRLGDWREPVFGLGSLPERSVDHIVTDPPYSEHVHRSQRRQLMRQERAKGQAAKIRNTDLGFEHITPEERAEAAREFARVVRRWVLVFADLEGAAGWIEAFVAAGLEHVRFGIWVKTGATPQFTGDRPGAGAEAIVIAHQQRDGRPVAKKWNGGGFPALWTCPIVLNRGGRAERLHTTQKPLDLMETLVRLFADEGETVCDPYAGSGTTAIACRRLGRRFLGWERKSTWHAAAAKRIAAAHEQGRLVLSEVAAARQAEHEQGGLAL